MGLLPGTGRAQAEVEAEAEAPSRSTVLMVQSLGLGMDLLLLQGLSQGATVEHAVGSSVAFAASVTGGVRSTESSQPGSGTGLVTSQGWNVRVDPGVHFYLAGRAPEGLWVGSHVEAALSQHDSYGVLISPDGAQDVKNTTRTFSYGGSVRVGYTAIFSPGLTVQVGLGLAALNDRATTTTDNPAVDGPSHQNGWSVEPRLSVGLGWAF
jgi:hypothetical protein